MQVVARIFRTRQSWSLNSLKSWMASECKYSSSGRTIIVDRTSIHSSYPSIRETEEATHSTSHSDDSLKSEVPTRTRLRYNLILSVTGCLSTDAVIRVE